MGKSMTVKALYKNYIELLPHNERYEMNSPFVTVNNLIIGTPYCDLTGTQTVRSLTHPTDYCSLDYQKRGWSSSSYFKVEGSVYKGKELVYRIEARWNESATLVNVRTGEREVVWQKKPYPENWEYMYGFTPLLLQCNYLPNRLKDAIAPTDTRWRPD